MALKIVKLHNTGNAAEEYVEIKADRSENLGEYIVADLTFDDEYNLSNTDRHVYWFPGVHLNDGDKAYLYTRPKEKFDEESTVDTGGKFTHFFYWGSKAAIWNDTGDTAYLYKTTLVSLLSTPVKLKRPIQMRDLLKKN